MPYSLYTIAKTTCRTLVPRSLDRSSFAGITTVMPGQGGTDHVNRQPNAYRMEEFADRGFARVAGKTEDWRADWRDRGVDGVRAKSMVIFRRRTTSI